MNKRGIFKFGTSGIRCHLKNSSRLKRSYEVKINSKTSRLKSKESEIIPDEWDNWFPWES